MTSHSQSSIQLGTLPPPSPYQLTAVSVYYCTNLVSVVAVITHPKEVTCSSSAAAVLGGVLAVVVVVAAVIITVLVIVIVILLKRPYMEEGIEQQSEN